jgi:hypothetical protein
MDTVTQTMPQVDQPTSYEQCESCGAAVDHAQRYCVVCGTHRRHVRDPAARYHASKTSRSRSAAAQGSPSNAPRSSNLLTALILALIPLAIGLGVLVGRASNNGDAKLLAALEAQRAQGAVSPSAATGTGTGTTAQASTSTLSSTFKLQNGYAVELQTLPATGTTGATVLSTESAARGKGATDVGLILQKDYKVTPAPPSGSYVIYSGAFQTSAQANQALSKLKSKFPKAVVIHVQSSSSVVAAGAGPGKVLARTKYGVANQIAGTKVTKTQLNQGAAIVKHISKVYGKSYVNSQKNLPSQISVP